MAANLKLGNITLEKEVTAKLVSVDEADHTAKVELNGISFTLVYSDLEGQLAKMVGQKVKIAPTGDVTEAPSKSSTEAKPVTRSSGCDKNESKDLWKL